MSRRVMSPPPGDANEQVAALIATLHETEKRLEEITAGEVDTVADRDGRTLLLRRAQDQLRHREAAKQAGILNALPAYIALLDTRGLIVSVNDAWRRFDCANATHGPGFRVGVDYLAICDSAPGDDPSEAHQVAEGIRSVLAGAVKSFAVEFSCPSSTEERLFLLTVTPVGDGHPDGAVVMQLDVTERRRNQEALAQSEAGLHRAEVMAKLAHVITGPDGAFERWSDTLPLLIGVEPAHLPQSTRAWLDILHPDDRSLFRDKAIEAGVNKLPMELEYRLRKADGEWIYVRQSMEPLQAEGDAPVGLRWFNTLQDITAERRTEESLRESERRFSDMLGNVQLVSVMVDRDARISYCNDYLLQLTGYRREEVIGRDWFERFITEPSVPKANFAALLANQPEARHRESDIVTRSGERRSIRWSNSVLRSVAGEVIGAASIGEDITERKLADEVLKKRAAELERFHRLSVGRELQMIELKKQINALAQQAGQPSPYDLAFLRLETVKTNPGHEQTS